jgi:hypothetical protein
LATSAAAMPQQSVKPRAMREIIVHSPGEKKQQRFGIECLQRV